MSADVFIIEDCEDIESVKIIHKNQVVQIVYTVCLPSIKVEYYYRCFILLCYFKSKCTVIFGAINDTPFVLRAKQLL